MYLAGLFQPVKNRDLPLANCICVPVLGKPILTEIENNEIFFISTYYPVALLLFSRLQPAYGGKSV